jgi:hypothetical protein
VQDKLDNVYIYDEYPKAQWNMVGATNKTIEQICSELKLIIGSTNFKYTLGDPNLMGTRLPNTDLTLAQEYDKHGVKVNFAGVNDSIIIGHSKIHEMLKYDRTQEISFTNHPRLYITANCKNVILAMQKYHYSAASINSEGNAPQTNNVEKEWKCFVDTIRYACTSIKPYIEQQEQDAAWKKFYEQRQNVGMSANGGNLW